MCNKSATKTCRNAAFWVKIKKNSISRAKNFCAAPGLPRTESVRGESTRPSQVKKRNGHLVKRTEVCYNIFCDAPSPSGKAGDFDSPIVGSTPAGATVEKPARFAVFEQIVRVLLLSGCGAGCANRFGAAGLCLRRSVQIGGAFCFVRREGQRRWIFRVGLRRCQPFKKSHAP